MSDGIHRGLVLAAMSDRSNPYQVRARRAYERLSDAQRGRIDRRFARHVRACESLGVDPDPQWVCEAVQDMSNGLEV
jgi:hypothetical protein